MYVLQHLATMSQQQVCETTVTSQNYSDLTVDVFLCVHYLSGLIDRDENWNVGLGGCIKGRLLGGGGGQLVGGWGVALCRGIPGDR